MRLLITVLTAATIFVILASVASASSGVHITALDCGSHPRRIRVENQGDAAQDLSGWQLQSDPVEGQPFGLGAVGSLGAGQKFFVFQGHLSPHEDPSVGYFRWGADEIFNLRANDSSDYVRLVDAQGNTVDQRNCEGLPPGATPAPTTEFDPPPIVAVVTDTPSPTPAPESAPVATTVRRPATSGTTTTSGTTSGLPAEGGPPSPDQRLPGTLPLAAAVSLMAAGTLLATLGLKRPSPGQ
jgi:hypothetical protein